MILNNKSLKNKKKKQRFISYLVRYPTGQQASSVHPDDSELKRCVNSSHGI